MTDLSGMLPWKAVAALRQQQTRATASRLVSSRHVADLRLLVSINLILLFLVLFFILFHVAEQGRNTDWPPIAAFLGASIALSISLINWSYQTGSKRLGVVDLFSCEISAVCRIYAVVSLADNLIKAYKNEHDGATAYDFSKMKIHESYTPVMDKSVSDLEFLDATTVSAVTAFYTYRRAMIDYMFRLGQETLDVAANNQVSKRFQETRLYLLLHVIYMLYLSLESARHAIDELIEYEPDHAESAINILLGELPCFLFLIDSLPAGDMRYNRLLLRIPAYTKAYNKVYHGTLSHSHEHDGSWERACTSAVGLEPLYEQLARVIKNRDLTGEASELLRMIRHKVARNRNESTYQPDAISMEAS